MAGMPIAFTFDQQLVLDIAGPLATAIVGGLLVGGLAGLITRKAQLRRAHRELREELIAEVTSVAATLYMATQQFWRAKDIHELPPEELEKMRVRLEAQYLDSRVRGTVLENRLEAYYESDRPRFLCHRLMDLLTVRYFQLALPQRTPYAANAGDEHTGLSEVDLKNPKLVLETYRSVLRELCHALLREQMEVAA
jgi:hypothetical protein